MELKPGVKLLGIRPELMMGLLVADAIYQSWSTIMVVTSCVDGEHMRASIHYNGGAADLRTRTLPEGKAQQVRDEIHEALGGDSSEFDVILEEDHIHLEWQPKTG